MNKLYTTILVFVLAATSGFAQTGGPDSFGYTYISSDATSGGPTYNWIEIDPNQGGNGTLAANLSSSDDSHTANFDAGFAFEFYGVQYDSISIASNGTIYFEDTYVGYTNNCLPGATSYTFTGDEALIAPIWDDLNPSSGGNIYTQSFGTYFVIQFEDVFAFGGSEGDTWQVILYDDGNILMQYKETSWTAPSTGLTVGIQGSATVGLEYLCDGTGDALNDSLAILWSNPTASVNEHMAPEVSIYPNPNNGQFNLNINSEGSDVTVDVTDLQGRTVYAEQFNSTVIREQVDLGSNATGMYIVTVRDEKSTTTKRVVVR